MSVNNERKTLHWQASSDSATSSNQEFAGKKFAETLDPRRVALTPLVRRRATGTPFLGDPKRIGRVGALAVMLGVGAALVAAPGIAAADKADSGSPRSSTERSQGSGTNTGSSAGRTSNDRSPAGDKREPKKKKKDDDSASGRGAGATGSPSENDDNDNDTVSVASDASASDTSDGADSDDTSAPDASSTSADARDDRTAAPSTEVDLDVTPVTSRPSDAPQTPAGPAQGALLMTASAASSTRRGDAAPTAAESVADTTALTATADSAAAEDEVIEAEAMRISRTRNGTTYTDATASGGSAVVLNKNSSLSTTASLAEFSSLVIRAKGDQYRGAPTMRVSVNGKVVSTVAVAATAWTDYTVDYSGPAGTYTVTVAFTNDLYSRKYGDRNLRLDSITAVAAAVEPPPPPASSAGGPGYFGGADWLWNPIGANPVVDANSATWVSYLSATNAQRVANLYEYSVAMVSASEITSSTPRYDVTLTQPWGSDPFGSTTVPIPAGTKIPPGSDGHLAILDPTTGTAYGIWQASYNSSTDTWSGSWGGMTDLNGDGIDETGSATAAAIARYAGVVTADEFAAAVAANTGLNHALAFSTDLAGPDFVYPAIKSDGQNWAGVATPIPEGYRIQLDPSLDIDAIPGITAGEKVIAKTLQTHGAYVVDQGGARMAFAFELVDDATYSSPGSVWTNAGFSWDYYDMNKIPWSSLRVLAPTTLSV